MLEQNNGLQAAIVARVAQARGQFGSIAQLVKEMPLRMLQTLRRQNVPFLH